ncbi:MAG TPA: 3-methyl-2-oxobutanoate hydroxymethyltransferase [Rhodanobacteraceae bacterium]|nr:3-methyl-2-oxobutanoate hydroxymethyltransferase [Rhodanobacteraceae bacterium]
MSPQSPSPPPGRPVTVPDLAGFKRRGEKIVVVTAYDASFAAAADAAGIDVVLVGDSLGNVVQGHASTLPVTVDQMVYHTACAARGLAHALLIADMPFLAARDVPSALANARRLIGEGGAAMVKLEGAGWACDVIRALAERDVPVCAHLGLTPQSVNKLGGYRVQGREDAARERLRVAARDVQDAGADLLVLECVPATLAAEITRELRIPTIGIGAGVDCDGQVLVMYDLIGLAQGRRPRFVRNFLAGHDSIAGALGAYASAVRAREFPAAEHCY